MLDVVEREVSVPPPTSIAHGWTPELVAGMDWLRIVELSRAVAASAGCELGGSMVFKDGSVIFAMMENPGGGQRRRAMVKIAPWNSWGASPDSVRQFAKEVMLAKDARGILIAPGGFTPAARQTAEFFRIETVDAAGLAGTLLAMPKDHSDFYFTVGTAGDFRAPTCPICLKKLSPKVNDPVNPALHPDGDYLIRTSAIVGEQVNCNRLEIRPECQVLFLREVRAREVIVRGSASGDFVVDGPLTIEAGASLSGTVAARAIHVRDGADLNGRTRILDGNLEPMTIPLAQRWIWACNNPERQPGCEEIAFEPHHEQSVA